VKKSFHLAELLSAPELSPGAVEAGNLLDGLDEAEGEAALAMLRASASH
jgi:hypothetical protein